MNSQHVSSIKRFYFPITSPALRRYTLQNLYSMDISLPHKMLSSSFTAVVCYPPLWLTLIFMTFVFLTIKLCHVGITLCTLCTCLPDIELRLFLTPIRNHTLKLRGCPALYISFLSFPLFQSSRVRKRSHSQHPLFHCLDRMCVALINEPWMCAG